MPNYKVHDLVCISSAPVITLASTQYLSLQHAILFGAGIILSNHFLSPDLDIDSIMNKRWSILSWIWIPYKKIFSHRSVFTHSGPLSATIRLVYLLWPLFLFIPWYDIVYYFRLYSTELILVYLGCIVSDCIHTGLDYVSKIRYIPRRYFRKTYRSP